MNTENIKSPGVYIDEINRFRNSVVPVATAIPAFIGYTPQASYEGKSYTNVPTKVTTFAEFQAIFMLPNPKASTDLAKQYSPQYYLVAEKSEPESGDYISIDGVYYSIVPDPNTIYYLYNSIRLFFENGGGDAYIVSVGTYGDPLGKPITPTGQIVNTNVKLNALTAGLSLLKNEEEPTMYICPEATLLSVADNGTLMQTMLSQCTEMQTAVSIFDIIGGSTPDPITYTNDIETFRKNTGTNGLSYGVAYYPFVGTSVMQSSDIDYTNMFGGDIHKLQALISPANNPNAAVDKIIKNINTPSSTTLTVTQNNKALLIASKTYSSIINHVLVDANMLPPSGGMAGVIATNDNQYGPWHSPANTSIVGVNSLPIKLTDSQQSNLNVDAITGKSINAIRFFNGLGILIWGARTLDGNSLDWKYLSVRRTITFIEQSCKLAAHAYVFEPNNKNTWEGVIAMISSFLTSVWKEGGLQGATSDEAFSVACGLGSTMTSEDILNGFMNVTIKVAVVRPAEFIALTFQQEQTTST